MKKKVIILTALSIVAITVMVVVLLMADQDENTNGGFSRTYASAAPIPVDTLDLGFDSYYIAGQTKHTLYLGNLVAPRHLISVNVNTFDTTHIALSLDNEEKLMFHSVRCKVDSPRVYLSDGTVPCIFTTDLRQGKSNLRKGPLTYFIDMEPMGKGSFAFRSLGADGVAKLGYANDAEIAFPGILSRQVDGVFCTAGVMSFSVGTNQLVYVHHYRNQIIILDSCLKVLQTSKTIDTVSTARITVASNSSSSLSVFSSPPQLVNRQSAVYNNLLAVHSSIQADNDAINNEISLIDMYRLDDGKYLFSVRIKHFNSKPVRFLRLFEDRMVVLFDKEIVMYHLGRMPDDQTALHVNRISAEHLQKK